MHDADCCCPWVGFVVLAVVSEEEDAFVFGDEGGGAVVEAHFIYLYDDEGMEKFYGVEKRDTMDHVVKELLLSSSRIRC